MSREEKRDGMSRVEKRREKRDEMSRVWHATTNVVIAATQIG